MLDIGLQSEYIVSILGFKITNTFFTSILVTILLSAIFIFFYLKRGKNNNIIIKSLRVIFYELMKLSDSVTQDRKLTKKILPIIATFLLFIAVSNLLALVPGFLGSFFIFSESGQIPILRSPNSDLSTTLALAIFAVLSVQYYSFKSLGFSEYLKRFINFSNPVKFIIGLFEMISEGTKLLSFSFRLFGNVFAGEVLLIIIAFLIPYIIPLPFMILEIFVGIIQAFIFSMLTLTFIKVSTIKNKI